MREKAPRQPENQQGQVTVIHVLMVMALGVSVGVLGGEVAAAGGGLLRYLVGLPLALILGCLIVLLNWHSAKFLCERSQGYGDRAQNIVGIGLFALQLVWKVLAGICGYTLAHLVIKFPV